MPTDVIDIKVYFIHLSIHVLTDVVDFEVLGDWLQGSGVSPSWMNWLSHRSIIHECLPATRVMDNEVPADWLTNWLQVVVGCNLHGWKMDDEVSTSTKTRLLSLSTVNKPINKIQTSRMNRIPHRSNLVHGGYFEVLTVTCMDERSMRKKSLHPRRLHTY